jgi:hypothetical protein
VAKYQTKCFTEKRPIVLPDDASAEWTAVDIEFPSTALASGDLIQLCKLPIGYKCLDWVLTAPDCDSGSALAFSLGVENTGGTDLGSEVWGTALAAAAGGVPSRNALSASAQGDISAVRSIDLKCTTAATGYTGTGKTGQLLLLLQG